MTGFDRFVVSCLKPPQVAKLHQELTSLISLNDKYLEELGKSTKFNLSTKNMVCDSRSRQENVYTHNNMHRFGDMHACM